MADNDIKRIIDEINKYCSPTSLLVIGKDGVLRRLFCPFSVLPIRNTQLGGIKQILAVDAVRLSNNLVMLYIIQKVAYPYSDFLIIL